MAKVTSSYPQPKAVDKDGGYRTIMAYASDGHATRVNYYSNPGVLFSVTGTATGVTGTTDNARVMVGNRCNYIASFYGIHLCCQIYDGCMWK